MANTTETSENVRAGQNLFGADRADQKARIDGRIITRKKIPTVVNSEETEFMRYEAADGRYAFSSGYSRT